MVSFLISVLVIVVVPKLIGVEAYAYWQLYLFYTLYVGFLHFGWCDGIYLRYGGAEYNKLDRLLFHSQFYSLLALQILFAGFILCFAFFADMGVDRAFVIKMTAISMVGMNVRWMLLYLFQATNRIKEYANAILVERVFYLVLLILLLTVGVRNFKVIVWADVIGKYVSLFFAIYFCRDIIFSGFRGFKFSFSETKENIISGSSLMFSNIASMLIIGTIRFGIERFWDVETFGKVSLVLSISNMFMLFINAMGLVLYPVLRRTKEDSLPAIYTTVREFLMPILFFLLLMYYPLKEAMSIWLPKYSDSLQYMAFLFPVFLYEGKMALLINTYMKTLRKEKTLLRVNILVFVLSVISTLILTLVFKDLNLLVLSIIVLLIIRSVLLEFHLSKHLKISVFKDITGEVVLTMAFIMISWFVDSWYSVLAYALCLFVYFVLRRKYIMQSVVRVKSMMKN